MFSKYYLPINICRKLPAILLITFTFILGIFIAIVITLVIVVFLKKRVKKDD